MRLISAFVKEFNKLQIEISGEPMFEFLRVINGDILLNISNIQRDGNLINILLKDEINIKYKTIVSFQEETLEASYSYLFKSDDFNDRYYYAGKLGALYSREKTIFKLWSPPAQSVTLLLYKNGDPSIYETPERLEMQEHSGLWKISVPRDLNGCFYTYEVTVYNHTAEVVDPYAKACGINGLRGAVIDLMETNPENWTLDSSPRPRNHTDAIIYEVSLRDISMHPNSGIIHKGKYLGLAELSTRSPENYSTGLDHILELGVTHIQFMPIFDFSYKSVDELRPLAKYNWGYDPQNYNIPEGSYSSDPKNPICRIRELKTLILTLHNKGLCVNMDVVYNHIFDASESSFERIFPGYYFRFSADGRFISGSGCGNDTASENLMMRKFIVDSITYWAKEFHIDGFRFDLMGIHDIATMREVRKELDKLSKSIMLYGEGWDLPTGIPYYERATQFNSFLLPDIGFFNDTIRNSVRGGVFKKNEKGFVSCKEGLENKIKASVTGCINYDDKISGLYYSPVQSINYVSSHDNNTLWDKLECCAGEFSIEDRKSMHKLAGAIVLTSQGIPFLHAGVEFCRSKGGEENSYMSPDEINRIDWSRKSQFKDVFEYFKGLITIRKSHPALRMSSADEVRRNLRFIYENQPNVIVFLIDGREFKDSWSNILIIYNGNFESKTIILPEGTWKLAANKVSAGNFSIRSIADGELEVEGISINILYR